MTVDSTYKRAIFTALALSAIFALSCATASPSSEAASGKPIVIGAVLPLTGYGAVFGASALNSMRLAVDEANAAGGALGRPLELRARDDMGDTTEGAAAFRASIEIDGAIAIAGTLMSKISLAGAPICQAAGVPMVTPTSTNPAVTTVGDYIFRACFVDPYQGYLAASFARKALRARTAACVYDDGFEYSSAIAATFADVFSALGGTVLANAGYATGRNDFRELLARIVAADPDFIMLPVYDFDAAQIAIQARELGYDGAFVGVDGWDSPELSSYAGNALEGAYFMNHWIPGASSKTSADFALAFRNRYGREPDVFAALGYDSVRIVIEGIRKAGSTEGAAIRDAIASTEFELATGTLRYEGSGDPVKSGVAVRIEDGAFVFDSFVDPPARD